MSRDSCFNCGAPSDHHHHVVPRALGGVATVSLCEPCHDKAHGRVGFRNTRELTRAALGAKRARGERTGTVPYGYTADAAGRLSPCAAEQTVITKARALRAAGMTFRAIVAELARAGVVGRTGRALGLSQVQRILTGHEAAS